MYIAQEYDASGIQCVATWLQQQVQLSNETALFYCRAVAAFRVVVPGVACVFFVCVVFSLAGGSSMPVRRLRCADLLYVGLTEFFLVFRSFT